MSSSQARNVLALLRRHTDTSRDLDLSPDDLDARIRGNRRFWSLVKCLKRIERFVVHYFPKIDDVEVRPLRCELRHNCPRCMGEDNVVRRREGDYNYYRAFVEELSGNGSGYGASVWVVQGSLPRSTRPIKNFTDRLKRADGWHVPILTGDWGGEAVLIDAENPAPQIPIRQPHNGGLGRRNYGISCSVLLISAPSSKLDIPRLREIFAPSACLTNVLDDSAQLNIKSYMNLLPAWEDYLRSWARKQVGERTPEEVEQWMADTRHGFQSIGLARRFRSMMEDRQEKRRQGLKGTAITLGICDTTQKLSDVRAHCEHSLSEKYKAMTKREMDDAFLKRAMERLDRQLDHALKPDSEETMTIQYQIRKLREELDEHAYRVQAQIEEATRRLEARTAETTLEQERKAREQKAKDSDKVQ